MNIYKFDWSGATDWIVADSEEDAVDYYKGHSGQTDLSDCEYGLVPKDTWDTSYVFDPDDPEPEGDDHNEDAYSCGYKIINSFAEIAAKATSTDIIATTEF